MSEYVMRFTNNEYETRGLQWASPAAETTNIQLSNVAAAGAGFVVSSLAGIAGLPQVVQVGSSIFGDVIHSSTFAVSALDQYNNLPGVLYPDHRARKGKNNWNPLLNRRDGASAALRKSRTAKEYAIASSLISGPYSIFNLQGLANTGYGFGDYGNPFANRLDFTLQSHVATTWDKTNNEFVASTNIIDRLTPFRGDKVNVIDFGKRSRDDIYRWKPNPSNVSGILGRVLESTSHTQDLIKFFFTGPKLQNGLMATEDDVIVFRAILNSLSDTFSPQWTPVQFIGRADSNYHYSSYSRDLNLDFVIAATDRDELKPIYRKLNALAGYTAPEYDGKSAVLKGPWLRFTLGDLYVQQPAFISSLTYTLLDNDTTWEINIEQDDEMMQVPHKVSVSMGLTLITDMLPQKGGQFYSLAKQWNSDAVAKPGNDNWLSDAKTNKTYNPTITVGTPQQIATNT